jgi:hypothetical protein
VCFAIFPDPSCRIETEILTQPLASELNELLFLGLDASDLRGRVIDGCHQHREGFYLTRNAELLVGILLGNQLPDGSLPENGHLVLELTPPWAGREGCEGVHNGDLPVLGIDLALEPGLVRELGIPDVVEH